MQDAIAKRLEGMKYFQVLVAAVALTFLQPAHAAESLEPTINYLLDHIAKTDAAFIRNGSIYTSAQAGEHIRAKYEHFKKDIKTPEDFIRLSATKSLLSNKPYLIKPKGEKEQPMSEWLTKALEEHRAATK